MSQKEHSKITERSRKVGEVGMIMIDIDIPDNCDECRFNTEYGFCKAMPDNFCGNTDDRKRPKWCPLKEQEAVIVHDPGAFCPQCGWMLYPEDHPKFCGNCGQTLKWELLK